MEHNPSSTGVKRRLPGGPKSESLPRKQLMHSLKYLRSLGIDRMTVSSQQYTHVHRFVVSGDFLSDIVAEYYVLQLRLRMLLCSMTSYASLSTLTP